MSFLTALSSGVKDTGGTTVSTFFDIVLIRYEI